LGVFSSWFGPCATNSVNLSFLRSNINTNINIKDISNMTTNLLRPPNADFGDNDWGKGIDHLVAAKDNFKWCGNYIIQLPSGQTPPRDLPARIPKPEASIGALDILPLEIMIQVSYDLMDYCVHPSAFIHASYRSTY
jgi:hypothetical protein